MNEDVTATNLAQIIPYIKWIIVFVLATFVILWGVSIYLVKSQRMSVQDWAKRALGLPQGSVRALIAFIILFLVVVSVIVGKNNFPELPQWLVGILGAVVGFYFGAATVGKSPEQPPQQTGEEGKPEKPGETPPQS